ncbi:hypothetical protein HNP47_002093 [Brevundimonas vesicularis]|uniref:Uncharacterized protein n=1 Tax=Brevundimonas vesicularis TaxID=41276 RepID=A0A7W9FV75_BREVE|nr:hypothetical protein [Brevundimonas vesicularis]MBB5772089.1 hypothetical protein [Brevundimonas vesicularis]
MAERTTKSPFIEVDFDRCIIEVERAPGTLPGGDIFVGDRLRCWTHAHVIAYGEPTYFQAIETCRLVRFGSRHLRPRRATRQTNALSADDAVKLYLAMLRANLLGMPLTYFATVSWTTLGLRDDAEIQAATQALMTRIREWSRRKRDGGTGARAPLPIAWIWCHERGPRLGLHTHFLMHVPPLQTARLGKVICRFLESYSGRSLAKGSGETLRTFMAIEPSRRSGSTSEATALRFQRRLMRYMMKGVDPQGVVPASAGRQHGQHFHRALKISPRDQGSVIGKRCGYSVHNLGRSAFAKHRIGHRLGGSAAENLLDQRGFTFDAEALQLHHLAGLAG